MTEPDAALMRPLRGTKTMSNQAYAGDLTPSEAWERLKSDPKAVLVDVRTQPEWMFVGVPNLEGTDRPALFVSWQVFPAMGQNPNFAQDLIAQGVKQDQTLLLLCRSGVRSVAAATLLTAQGFSQSYNILEGFEGPLDETKHRSVKGGWKAAGLPWKQA